MSEVGGCEVWGLRCEDSGVRSEVWDMRAAVLGTEL